MRLRRFRFRRAILLLLALLPLSLVLVVAANWWIVARARSRVYTRLDRLPANEIGIVLGTAPILAHGRRNAFFEGRMDAAAELYRAGKVRHLLLTGDNGTREYDEPAAMRQALLARGVPASALTVDDAGFRTLDSMARASAVFGIEHATIITDDFHQARALFLANAFGVNAVGYPSRHVLLRYSRRTVLREYAARTAALVDVYVLRTQPRFRGPREILPTAQL